MPGKNILIVSGSGDSPSFNPVVACLKEQGHNVIVFEPDSVANGSREFTLHASINGRMHLSYDGQPFDPMGFDAGWCRKPDWYGPQADALRWFSLRDEYRVLQRTLWEIIPSSIWLNAPYTMHHAAIKLPQLVAAAAVGFRIPETVMSNSWQAIESFEQAKLIVKMSESTILHSGGDTKAMPTTIVQKDRLPKQALPYPGIWQPYVQKKREWRITIVGDRAFSVAIYTEPDAKDDWRTHQYDSKVSFKVEQFPQDQLEKCFTLLEHFNLRYGGFDFIETPDGEIVFLEVNPGGQFMWLEKKLNLPISEAIASELIAITSKSRR